VKFKEGLKYLAKFAGLFVYFAIGLFFIVIAAGAAAGGLITGDSWAGVWILFTGGIIVALGYIGKTMITKIQVSFNDLQIAFKKAAEKVEEEAKKK
jgi:hypothetical protein